MIIQKEQQVCKTEQGEDIRLKQLEHLNSTKLKLIDNVKSIENRAPYIDVKVAVKRMF
jgi:hypothetical protein